MSLLGTQVYANTDRNVWLPVTGGTVQGSLTVNGNIVADGVIEAQTGPIITDTFVSRVSYDLVDNTNTTRATISLDPANSLIVGGTGSILFNQSGQVTGNTTLTLSAPGSGLDNLTTNFLNAIGPIPTNIITSPKTINPVPITPAPYDPFTVDAPYPTINGAVYDVQATGVITLASGVSDPDDSIRFELDAGTGTSITTYTFYPEGPGQSGNWSIRQRIVANAVQPSLGVAVQGSLAGASTAVYSATMNYFSVVRVA